MDNDPVIPSLLLSTLPLYRRLCLVYLLPALLVAPIALVAVLVPQNIADMRASLLQQTKPLFSLQYYLFSRHPLTFLYIRPVSETAR